VTFGSGGVALAMAALPLAIVGAAVLEMQSASATRELPSARSATRLAADELLGARGRRRNEGLTALGAAMRAAGHPAACA